MVLVRKKIISSFPATVLIILTEVFQVLLNSNTNFSWNITFVRFPVCSNSELLIVEFTVLMRKIDFRIKIARETDGGCLKFFVGRRIIMF